MTKPHAPAHLSKASRALWRSLNADFAFEKHQLQLLTLACEALDRCEEARQAIKADGAYFTDRFGQPRPHPGLKVEQDAGVRAARLFRELAIDPHSPEESRIPRPVP